ncbi:MAG: peptidyl-prolyl cis-trans isomerase [Deltaproteobacteria bacterium]
MRQIATRQFIRTAFICLCFIFCLSLDANAFWPFDGAPEKDYLVLIGGSEKITTLDLLEDVGALHKSGRVGKALTTETSFEKQSYSKFLDELIDNKLMAFEARNLNLNESPDLRERLRAYSLNLFLDEFRKEEILDKITVADEEVEVYYREQLKKKQEAKDTDIKKDEPDPHGAHAGAHAAKKDEAAEGDKDKKDDNGKKEMPQADRDAIRKGLLNEKAKAAEKIFFAGLRESAKIEIDEAALKSLSKEAPESAEKTVATVDGEAVKGVAVLSEIEDEKGADLDARKAIVDRLILHRLLDREAAKKGYDKKDEALRRKIVKYEEKLLVEQFKKKAVLPTIKVEEKDVLEYYEANKDKYKTSPRAALSVIHVTDEAKAKKILEDLKSGADFAFIARTESIDPSKEKGGDVGWVEIDKLHGELMESLRSSKAGDALGPIAMPDNSFIVVKVNGYEAAGYVPVEKVGRDINIMVGRGKFTAAIELYIKRLKETVSIDINQKELDRIEGK